jgi:hypothetical protein
MQSAPDVQRTTLEFQQNMLRVMQTMLADQRRALQVRQSTLEIQMKPLPACGHRAKPPLGIPLGKGKDLRSAMVLITERGKLFSPLQS